MKKELIFVMTLIAAGIMSFTMYKSQPANSLKEVEIPENVKKIIDAKCQGCHSQESNSLKAKTKLKFEQLSELPTGKLIGKLEEIAEEVEEGEMPPARYLKKNPDKNLSEEEAKALIEWAHSAADQLMQ